MVTPEKKPLSPEEERIKEENKQPKKNPLQEGFEKMKKNEKFDEFYTYASHNTRDLIAYVLMIIGIALLFSNAFYGGLLIGIVFGLYFTKEIKRFALGVNEAVEKYGMVRSLIIGLVLLALLIAAPAIFLGTVVTVAVKEMLFTE